MPEPGFASLGPSLLARKGGAKPAMRPQVAPLVAPLADGESDVSESQLEDLGWNDMGHDVASEPDLSGSGEVVPISGDIAPDLNGPGPIVRRQQRRLEERVLADAAMTGAEDDEDAEYDEDSEGPIYGEAYDAEDYAAEDFGAEEDADESLYAPLVAEPAAAAPAPAPVVRPARSPAPAKPRVPAAQSGRRAAFTLRLDADRHLKLRLAATMQGVSAQVLVTEALDRLLAEYDDLDVIANHLKRH